ISLAIAADDPVADVFPAGGEGTAAGPFLHDGPEPDQFRVLIVQRITADQDVVTAATEELVGTGAADDQVAAGATDQDVGVGVADQQGVALASGHVLDVTNLREPRG